MKKSNVCGVVLAAGVGACSWLLYKLGVEAGRRGAFADMLNALQKMKIELEAEKSSENDVESGEGS